MRLIPSEVTLRNTCLNFLPREDYGDGEEAVDEMESMWKPSVRRQASWRVPSI